MNRINRQALARGMFVVLASLMLNALVYIQNIFSLTQVTSKVSHTNAVLYTLEKANNAYTRLQDGTLRFITTGNARVLDGQIEARHNMNLQLDSITHLTVDNPHQNSRVKLLAKTMRWQDSIFEVANNVQRLRGEAAATVYLEQHNFTSIAADLRMLTAAVAAEENIFLVQRTRTAHLTVLQTIITFCFFTLASSALVFFIYRLLLREIQNRSKTEHLVQESERRFRALVEYGADIIILLTSNADISFASPSAHRLVGTDVESLVGKSIMNFIHVDDQESFKVQLSQLIENPQQAVFAEFRIRTADMEWRWVESAISNMLFFKTVKALVMNFREITERKKAEFVLRESNARTQKFATRLHELNDATILIQSAVSLQDVIQQVADFARQLLNAHHSGITILTPTASINYIYAASVTHDFAYDSVPSKEPDAILPLFTENMMLTYTQDELENDPELFEMLVEITHGQSPINGWMCTALISEGEIVGFLDCTDRVEGQFDEDDTKIFVQLSLIASSAIENFNLHQKQHNFQLDTTRQNRRLEATIDSLITPLLTLNDNLDVVVANTAARSAWPSLATGTSFASVLLPENLAAFRETLAQMNKQSTPRQTFAFTFAGAVQHTATVVENKAGFTLQFHADVLATV